MDFLNKYIIIIIVITIIIVFICKYDVYIVEKNKPLCENIYIDKKTLTRVIPTKTDIV